MNHDWIKNTNRHFSLFQKRFGEIQFNLIILILVFSIKISGQNSKQNIDGYSINSKLGLYNWIEDDAGFMGGAELNVLKNRFIYSLDFYRYEELVIFSPTPSEYYNQIGIMIGKYKGNNLFRFQYQGGLASFWGTKRTDLINKGFGLFSSDKYQSKHFYTVGLIGKFGFKIIPLTFLAIGIDLQTNINLENSVYIPMISIEFGKLRSKINEPSVSNN
jgi:hypothetical protein